MKLFIFLLIILTAAFLRFYNLEGYMTFLGDEGRDALQVKRILIDRDFPLLGPPMSVGNVYLGPLYYYMMSVPMAIFYLEPAAAAAMVALIGVLTVVVIYYLANKWFGFYPAILASLLYTLSPVTIIYSRSSWNPNPAPFFSLLLILSLYKLRRTGNFLWVVLAGMSLAFGIQMHYTSLLLIPVFLIFFFLEVFKNQNTKNLILGSFLGLLTFFILMSPLLIFDLKYNFSNTRAFVELLSGKNTPVEKNLLNPVQRLIPLYKDNLIGRYIAGENAYFSIIISILVLIPVLRKINFPVALLGTWLTVGLAGLTLYRQEIFDHYLGFINPAPFLLLGAFINFLPKRWQLFTLVFLLLILLPQNFFKNPLLKNPNNQLKKTQEITKFVIRESEEKPFNFALLAERNYDSAYQFYFYRFNHLPKLLPGEITEQLFVVCEDLTCQPIGNPKYEIAAFGWAKIEDVKDFLGAKVYKLVANPTGKP